LIIAPSAGAYGWTAEELDKIIERSQPMPAETSPGKRENIEYSRHYEDKHHKDEHGGYGHKGHKRKSFLSELFD